MPTHAQQQTSMVITTQRAKRKHHSLVPQRKNHLPCRAIQQNLLTNTIQQIQLLSQSKAIKVREAEIVIRRNSIQAPPAVTCAVWAADEGLATKPQETGAEGWTRKE
jgi:hypothetical protein